MGNFLSDLTIGRVARCCNDLLLGEMALREIYLDDADLFHLDERQQFVRLQDHNRLGSEPERTSTAIRLFLGERLPETSSPEQGFGFAGAVTASAPPAMRLTLCLSSARAMHSPPLLPQTPLEDRKRLWLAGARAALGSPDRLPALRQDLDRGLRRASVEQVLSLRVVSASGLSFAATDLLWQYPQQLANAAVAAGKPARNTVRLLQQRLTQLTAQRSA